MISSDPVRAWLAPPPGASLPGIDVTMLDPGDADDRAMLVRAQHPDLAAAIDDGDDDIDVDGEPMSPRLHLAIHEVVAAQLWSGDPPQARRAAERLLSAGHDRHEALHLIGAAVAEELWAAQRTGVPADPDRYVAALDALAADDIDGFEGPRADDLDLGTDDIDVGDEEAFDDIRAWLLEGHRRWLSERGLTGDDWVAHQMLDFKWGHLDGHLGRWRVADLREILLELFPRKTIVDEEDLDDVVPAAGRFLTFLDDSSLLADDGETLPRLHDELARIAPSFAERMRDAAGFGLAKSLFTGMLDDGVDPDEPGAVEAWIERFNALPDDERARLLPGPPSRGVVHLEVPDDATLAVAAFETPVMRQIAAFLDWVGDDGHQLTQKGNVKLGDGKVLVELLDTADQFDPTIGDRTFRTTSTTELPGVDLVFRLALATRLARRHRGRVLRTRRGAGLADDPLAVWRGLVDAMLDIGLIDAGRDDRHGLRWWVPFLEEGAGELLGVAASAGEPLPVDALARDAVDELGATYDLDAMPDVVRRSLPEVIAGGVGRLVDRLAWLGVATRDGVVVARDHWGDERRDGGELALTGLGRWFVRPMLTAQGYDVAVAGELADASADALLAAVADRPTDAIHAEVRAWATARDDAAHELAAAARHASTPDGRALAFEALEVVGDDAVDVVRDLTDDPLLRPWAMGWLVARGDAQPDALTPADATAGFVQALAVALTAGGPDAVVEMLAADTPVAEQTAIIAQLWRVDDPYTVQVLEALAGATDRTVAKAARKALFKHRTAASNRTG
ncbi:MAG TPA: DUF1841 family protein [Euzebyales bacterium]